MTKLRETTHKPKKKNPNRPAAQKRKLAANKDSQEHATSTSAKKLSKKLSQHKSDQDCSQPNDLGNALVDMNKLSKFLQDYLQCSECNSTMVVSLLHLGGLAQCLHLNCSQCDFTLSQDLSKKLPGMTVTLSTSTLVHT